MKEDRQQLIDSKFSELARELKIEFDDRDWEDQLRKELWNISIYRSVFLVLVFAIVITSIVIMASSLIFNGKELFGIFIKEKYFYIGMLITLTISMGLNFGLLNLRKEKIKTFLFLNQLNNQ